MNNNELARYVNAKTTQRVFPRFAVAHCTIICQHPITMPPADTEIIYLSSDPIDPPSPLPIRHETENIQRSTAESPPAKSSQGVNKGKGKGVDSPEKFPLEFDLPDLDVGLTNGKNRVSREAGEVLREARIPGNGSVEKVVGDPISSWDWDLPENRNTLRPPPITSRLKVDDETEDVIVIEDSPIKPPIQSIRTNSKTKNSKNAPEITTDLGFSPATSSLLADILGRDSSESELGAKASKSTAKRSRSERQTDEIEDIDLEEIAIRPRKRLSRQNSGTVPGSPGRRKAGKLTEEEKEKRVAEKARKAAEKEAEKEAKRLEKEAKVLEKQKEQELNTVNKLKNSKTETVKEMIVDISTPFSESPAGLQLVRFLETQECESTTDWASPVPNTVKWRRKVTAMMDDELGHYVPVPKYIEDESHVLAVFKAEDFVDMIAELDSHVSKVKSLLGGAPVKPIYMIEGLAALLRKSKSAKNRNFQGAVRQVLGGAEEGAAPKTGRRKNGRDYTAIDEDAIEDALLNLQITHGCLIHHTATMQETSEWISVFTRDISFIPYEKQMDLGLSFCTKVGQVKTGVDSEDTFFRMLQEINRVTAGVANGIMGEYKTVQQLVAAFKEHGEDALADLEMTATRNGASSGRAIGSATSRRIYRIFMGQDPYCADV